MAFLKSVNFLVMSAAPVVIFLDVDGVLLPVSPMSFGGGDLDDSCLAYFKTITEAIIAQTTGGLPPVVILSSTWRHDPAKIERLNQAFLKAGFHSGVRVVGGVPNGVPNPTTVSYLPKDKSEQKLVRDRVDEIHEWLKVSADAAITEALKPTGKCLLVSVNTAAAVTVSSSPSSAVSSAAAPPALYERWIAIDDMDLGVDPRMRGHFLKTDTEEGMTKRDSTRGLETVSALSAVSLGDVVSPTPTTSAAAPATTGSKATTTTKTSTAAALPRPGLIPERFVEFLVPEEVIATVSQFHSRRGFGFAVIDHPSDAVQRAIIAATAEANATTTSKAADEATTTTPALHGSGAAATADASGDKHSPVRRTACEVYIHYSCIAAEPGAESRFRCLQRGDKVRFRLARIRGGEAGVALIPVATLFPPVTVGTTADHDASSPPHHRRSIPMDPIRPFAYGVVRVTTVGGGDEDRTGAGRVDVEVNERKKRRRAVAKKPQEVTTTTQGVRAAKGAISSSSQKGGASGGGGGGRRDEEERHNNNVDIADVEAGGPSSEGKMAKRPRRRRKGRASTTAVVVAPSPAHVDPAALGDVKPESN